VQKLGNRRVTGTEQYYTPPELARELTEVLIQQVGTDRSFLEPAGGNGSFINALQGLGVKDIESVDLYPKHPLVRQGNFLEFQPGGREFVTISNPPFGRNNALSVPFFNHAATMSSHIAFLVPRSWRKWSVLNRLHQNFHLKFDLDVQINYQSETGEPIGSSNELRSCFQIWERQAETRGLIRVRDQHLVEKTNPEDADLAIRVFGFGCGSVLKSFPRTKNTTLMFLRVLNPKVMGVIEGLDYGRFINNTAYTQALALPELNYLLNEAIFGDPMMEIEAARE
jgi:hypothetical protein